MADHITGAEEAGSADVRRARDAVARGEDCEAQKDWVRAFYAALRPHSTEGGYVNLMDGDDQDRVRANYGANHARLTDIKRRYGPGNLFRLNHNIAP